MNTDKNQVWASLISLQPCFHLCESAFICGASYPPAMAGMIDTSSPGFTGVSRFSRNRMSSSLT